MVVTMNFESKEVYTGRAMIDFLLAYYDNRILSLYEKINTQADNNTTWIFTYYDNDSNIAHNIAQGRLLAHIMLQNCVACTMDDNNLSLQAIIGKRDIDPQYIPFNPQYFTTIQQAIDNPAECRCVYSNSIGRVRA